MSAELHFLLKRLAFWRTMRAKYGRRDFAALVERGLATPTVHEAGVDYKITPLGLEMAGAA